MSPRVGSGRVDVPPTTWEIPVVAALTWVLAAGLLLPAGRGAAAWAFGGGWVWPAGAQALLSSIGGLATGRPTAGLDAAAAAALPPPALVYVAVAGAELMLIAATVVAVRVWWTTVGPGSVRGMATRTEAEAVLGVGELRKARAVLRPDLYGAARRPLLAQPWPDDDEIDERLRDLHGRYSQTRTTPTAVQEDYS